MNSQFPRDGYNVYKMLKKWASLISLFLDLVALISDVRSLRVGLKKSLSLPRPSITSRKNIINFKLK